MTEKEREIIIYRTLIELAKNKVLKGYAIETDNSGIRTDTFHLFNNSYVKYLFDNDDCFIDCWTE